MSRGLFALVLVTAIGSGIIGGVFFAFSTFVMRALGRIPAPQGIAAMQSINITVICPPFMIAFLGTAVASIALGVVSVVRWGEAYAAYLLIGGVLYLIGTFLTTMAGNVPMNNELAALDPATPEAAAYWGRFLTGWTAWNHVRTVAALAAAALLIAGIRVA